MTSFDPEIERTAHAIRRVVREETLAQRILVEDNSLISSDTEEEINMEDKQPQTMRNYRKRTDE